MVRFSLAQRISLQLLGCCTLLLCLLAAAGQSQAATVQHFRVTPHDIQILEGTDTLLRCEIGDRVGQVQWTKDGFALGFSAVIHGFPRYSVLVDAPNGIYNLQIKNASLEDDAEYQCQVGPAQNNPAIRANAKLNIIAAPTSINIENYMRGVKVEVVEKQNLTLKCVTEGANPAAEIVWFKANLPLANENPKVEINETSPKRFRTISTITIKPRIDDDFKDVTCEARHKALPPDVPMRSNLQLSVLYPPGAPSIEGYKQGDFLRRGQKVEITCISRGGNPPAQITWYKNGVQIASPQRTSGRVAENVYKFVAEETDNDANLLCEAKNILSNVALKAAVNLTVLFEPKNVSISGPTEAKIGDLVELNCVTAPSNPPARISWSINGHPLVNSTSGNKKLFKGGWISTSNASFRADTKSRTFIVVCRALNVELTQNVVSTHTVNVLLSPSPPVLTGYNDGEIVVAGSVKKLYCSSSDGNPVPTLTWYKNDKRLNALVKQSGNKISSEISILVNASDNQAIYKCEVQNPATEIPLFATKTLSVYYPPETVKISVVPKNLTPGISARLLCDSSSSNPPAKVSWWKDGIPISDATLLSKPGLWGGAVATLELGVNITQDLDGVVYTCQSINEALQRSVHESISLDILYGPKFKNTQQKIFTGVEGEQLSIVLEAIGNPMAISYAWTKDGFPISTNTASGQRIFSNGAQLNISKLDRADAGNYVCEAINSQGTAIMEIYLLVEYAATIESVSEGVSFDVGEEGVLKCSVNGQPLTAEHVYWTRSDYDMEARTTTTFENGTSYLHIKNVERKDSGNFTCVANNHRGAADKRNSYLIVQMPPELDHTPAYSRFAGQLGKRARMACKAIAAPEPTFIWRRRGKDLNMQARKKFKILARKLAPVLYESTLLIDNVATDDYGQYECVARNAHGQASSTVEFSKPIRPDTPLEIRVVNSTADGQLTLAWTPGFDGGLPNYYRLRYKLQDEDKYSMVDAQLGYLNATVDGLKSGATYLFSVMAANEAGTSKFLPDLRITMSNGAYAHPAEFTEKEGMPNLMIIGITSAAMFLLVLNAALVAWFVIRRQNKSANESGVSNDDVYSKEDNQSVYKLPISVLQGTDVANKAASTYLVENVDIIQSTAYPPKYQESSICIPPYNCNPDFTRTLPNPKRQNNRNGMADNTVARAQDDQMLVSNGLYIPSPSPASSLVIKGTYISSPSPAPPPDCSYFNMSDKYVSYLPVTY